MVFRDSFGIITIKNTLCLAYRRSLCPRLLRTNCFQITSKNIEEQKILEKYQPLSKAKVNKKCQAINQLFRNKIPLSVSLKGGQKYKDGKQFKLLRSLEHCVDTVLVTLDLRANNYIF